MRARRCSCSAAVAARAQNFSQRGFLETTALFFPQAAPNDSATRRRRGALPLRSLLQTAPSLRFAGGIDARTDTHQQTEREFGAGIVVGPRAGGVRCLPSAA